MISKEFKNCEPFHLPNLYVQIDLAVCNIFLILCFSVPNEGITCPIAFLKILVIFPQMEVGSSS